MEAVCVADFFAFFLCFVEDFFEASAFFDAVDPAAPVEADGVVPAAVLPAGAVDAPCADAVAAKAVASRAIRILFIFGTFLENGMKPAEIAGRTLNVAQGNQVDTVRPAGDVPEPATVQVLSW
jgi:hypothetical protein